MENQFLQQLSTITTNSSFFEHAEGVWIKSLVLNCLIISIIVLLVRAVSCVFNRGKIFMSSADYFKIWNKLLLRTNTKVNDEEKINDNSIIGFTFILSLTNLAVLWSLNRVKLDKLSFLKNICPIILIIQLILGAIDLIALIQNTKVNSKFPESHKSECNVVHYYYVNLSVPSN